MRAPPLGPRGEVLYPAVAWHERRPSDEEAKWSVCHPDEELFRVTGLHKDLALTLFKWLWLKSQRPEVWRRCATWVGIAAIKRVKTPELVAVGAALLASQAGLGRDLLRQWVPQCEYVQPDNSWAGAYAQLQPRFQELAFMVHSSQKEHAYP